LKLELFPFDPHACAHIYSNSDRYDYRHARGLDAGVIIDAEKRELELTVQSLEERIDALELRLAGVLSQIHDDYAEMKGLERDLDDIYRHVF
jgi:hypothetical protein